MKAPERSLLPSSEAIDPWPVSGALNVAAIYETFAAGIRLKEALVALERSLGRGRTINKTWSFSMLERLDVRATAIREAAEADILIVVGECDQNYPVQIIRWLEHCLVESSGGPAALVDLHDDVPVQEGAPTTPHSKVAEIAGRWQMNLITNSKFDDWLNDENIHQIVRRPAASLAFSDS